MLPEKKDMLSEKEVGRQRCRPVKDERPAEEERERERERERDALGGKTKKITPPNAF